VAPRFSIVLAVRNAAHLLPVALEALQRQTFQDFEVVVVDGLSTDGTLDLLTEASRSLPIKLVSERDNGISDAYAKGLRRATGDLVIMTSADERLDPQALSVANRWFADAPEAIVCCGRTDFSDAAGTITRGYTVPRFDLESHLNCEVVLPVSASFFNRLRLGEDLRMDASAPTCPDYELWGRLAFTHPKELFKLYDVRIATALATRDSMSFRAESFDPLTRDKAAHLDRLLETFVAAPDRDQLRKHSLAGIHMWAAQQLIAIGADYPDIFKHCIKALSAELPQDMVLAWNGVSRKTLETLVGVWQSLGFGQPILADKALLVGDPVAGAEMIDAQQMHERADAFIFDCAAGDGAASRLRPGQQSAICAAFFDTVRAERARPSAKAAPRRIICMNAIDPPFETLTRHIGAAFATRLRHGFVLPPAGGKQEWIADLEVGVAGVRQGESIHAKPGQTGVVCHGPYRPLFPGHYRFDVRITGDAAATPAAPVALLELKWGQRSLDFTPIRASDLKAGRIVTDVWIGEQLDLADCIQAIVQTRVPVPLRLDSLTCERLESASASHGKLGDGVDWLDLLGIGPAGQRRADNKVDVKASGEFVVFGPYLTLPAGRYECLIGASAVIADQTPFLTLEVFSNGRYRAVTFITAAAAQAGDARAEFEVHEDETPGGAIRVELRVLARGVEGVLDSAVVRRIGDAQLQSPWVEYPEHPAEQRSGASPDAPPPRGLLSVRVGRRTVGSILAGVKRRAEQILGG